MTENKTKILLTTGIFPPEIGGPATYSALLEKELPKFKIDVEVLPFRTVRHLPKVIRHFVFLFKVLRKGRKADLLYSQDPLSVGFPTALVAKILGKPFLVRIAGDYAWEQAAQRFGVKEGIDDFQSKKYGFQTELMRFLQTTTAEMADEVISPSKYFANLVSNWKPGKIKARAIYNGIDFSDIPENDGNFEPKTIISAGRLVPWKGFDCLIEMMKDLPDWKLFIAGDGPDKNKLLKLIEDLKLNGRVFLMGKVERKELIGKMQKCEIFVLNTSFESFSFQIVEAMFAGVPVISTDIGNISEIIDNEKEGLLVSPNDKKKILEAIRRFSDQMFRSSIVAKAKTKAGFFSVEKTLAKTSEIILRLIQKNHGSFFKRNILLRYFVCGITAAATNIILLYIFTEFLNIWYIFSSILSFLIALIVSFILQKFVVFMDMETNGIHCQFSRFFIVAVLGVATNTALFYIFTSLFGVWYILSQILAGMFVMVQNFIFYKFFIFNREK